jgi:diadenosine tetraphosphate (Ap4A) HIT family hydrolase
VRFWCKKFYSCPVFIHFARGAKKNASRNIGHFFGFSAGAGSVVVRATDKCHISGRRQYKGIGTGNREGCLIRRYAAVLSLGAPPKGWPAKLNNEDQPGVRAVFALDPRLQQDTLVIGDFPLSRLLLSNDANYPWFILVPRRDDISELFQLDVVDQQQLWQETTALAELLKDLFDADKMNVATLGNVVSQLHMHVIVRIRDDAAWPAPVWGKVAAKPYSDEQVAAIRERLRAVLTEHFTFVEG